MAPLDEDTDGARRRPRCRGRRGAPPARGCRDGQTYTPTGPAAVTHGECAAILSEVLGRPVRSTNPTPWAYWRAMARQGMPRAMIGVTLGIGSTDHADHRVTSIDHRQPTDVEFGEGLGDIGERGLGLDGTRPLHRAKWQCRFLFGSRSLPSKEVSLMPVAATLEGSLSTRISPSAVVWVNGREATVVQITSDGRMSTFEISRGWLRETPFLAHIVHAIGDQKRLLIWGPGSIRLALEREYASMFPRPERLVEGKPSGPVDAPQLADRIRAFAT